MRCARGERHPAETLAVAVGLAANAGALTDRGPLYLALDGVDKKRKAAVCEKFPKETDASRLWVIPEAWDVCEDLGFWPKSPPEDSTKSSKPTPQELAVIAALRPWQADQLGGMGIVYSFTFADPDFQPWDPYEDWDEGDPEWRLGFDSAAEAEDAPWYAGGEPLQPEGAGPLGYLNVDPPMPPPAPPTTDGSAPDRRTPISMLCMAPESFRCAIEGRVCSEPVRTPQGILYERTSILTWASWNQVCPVTGAPLAAAELQDEVPVSESIAGWLMALQ